MSLQGKVMSNKVDVHDTILVFIALGFTGALSLLAPIAIIWFMYL